MTDTSRCAGGEETANRELGIPRAGIVLTLTGLNFNLYNNMPRQFGGMFARPPYVVRQVRYPASLASDSIAKGVDALDARSLVESNRSERGKQEASMTDDRLGWLDYVPVGGDRSTGAEILLCFERTMLCDERLPADYRREVRERIWRRLNESHRHFDAGPKRR